MSTVKAARNTPKSDADVSFIRSNGNKWQNLKEVPNRPKEVKDVNDKDS